MAEITAQDLYNQLTPLEKQQYDGVMGMGGFKQKYEENPTSQFVLGDANYAKFKAVADAEKAVPEKGLFSIFSSASAAEPDRISSVSGTPGFQTVANPDGTISIVPVDTSSSLPFNVGDRLFNQFNTATAVPNVANESYISPTYLMKQQLGMVPTGIMTQAPLQNLGFDTSLGVANEEDVEQVDYLGSKPNKVQTGIAKLFEFLQRFSPVANIARGIESIRNKFDTRRAIKQDIDRDPQGTLDKTISPRIMNIKPTSQDIARGGGSIPTRTTSTKSRRDTSPSSSYSQASYARRR